MQAFDACRNRTGDPLLRRQMLYPAELKRHVKSLYNKSRSFATRISYLLLQS